LQQLKKLQYKLNNIIFGNANEIITEPVIGRTRRPEARLQNKLKPTRHQHRICYKCRQTDI